MTEQLLFDLFYDNDFPKTLASQAGLTPGQLDYRQFPDGESLLRVASPVAGARVRLVANLHKPDEKFVPLALLARHLREAGATQIDLIAPYLPYMRQDKAFQPGEAVSARHFAALLGESFDSLVTVEPHLHRIHTLDEVYTIPARALKAQAPIADWIRRHMDNPLIIGPDSESRQWAEAVARLVGCPVRILEKERRGDKEVEVSIPDIDDYRDHTPVLVDDIISTGRTLIAAAHRLQAQGTPRPICLAVHAVFAGDAWQALQQAPIDRVVSCDSIPHPSNAIRLAPLLAEAIQREP